MNLNKPTGDKLSGNKHSIGALKARQQEFEQRTAVYGPLLGVLVIGGLVIAAIVSAGVGWSMALGVALGLIRLFVPRSH